ncbi:LysR family transcriptional regulator [Duganella aceris]|uniref:LysR family transcriptional regulator n=1 Tax=Duganella aceris TaxID=2703883 RepID=A0ABX0FV67_9BURK|nr:LysR family transcriptional regulator [Duganella aceris]NGZ88349.1 LysR family transcriptional regulator [Duganella aceris]
MNIDIGSCDWNDLKTFLVVARSGTQAYAAKVLGQSQPTIGRRIRALERSLGSSLFYRDARGLSLTIDGMELLRNVERMESEAQSIQRRSAAQEELSGLLRVSAGGWLGAHLLAPAFARFHASQPQIQIHLTADAGSANLVRREVDVVIQTRRFDAPDLIERKLMQLPHALYGQADYLRLAGPVAAGGRGHALMVLTGADGEAGHGEWLRSHLGHARTGLRTECPEALLQWCRNGMGLALLPVAVAAAYPQLAPVPMPEAPAASTVWAGYHADLRCSPRLRALLDIVLETTVHVVNAH